MKKSTRFTIAMIVLFFGLVLLAKIWHRNPESPSAEGATGADSAAEAADPKTAPEVSTTPTEIPSQNRTIDETAYQKNFSDGLREFNTCFNANVSTDPVEVTFENLDSLLRPVLGEMISKNQEWSDTQIKTESGEERHLRLQLDFSGEDGATRRLTYFRIDPSGTQVPFELGPDQSEDPNDTFIASLEGDGEVVHRQHEVRVYYPNGEEVLFNDVDGKLMEFMVTRLDGKRFECMKLATEQSSCRCK